MVTYGIYGNAISKFNSACVVITIVLITTHASLKKHINVHNSHNRRILKNILSKVINLIEFFIINVTNIAKNAIYDYNYNIKRNYIYE